MSGFMSGILLIMVLVCSCLSLLSYLYCWIDIRGGRPHILSLRQITNVMDRNKINSMFGEPQPGFYYKLEPVVVALLMQRRKWYFYRECAADAICVLGAWHYLAGDTRLMAVQYFLFFAIFCQGLNIVYSIILVRKWGDQIREEIENSED